MVTKTINMKKIIKDTNFAEISYDTEFKVGKIVWKRKTESSEYHEAFNTLLEFSKKNDVENFLSDINNQGIVSPENRKWFETEMLPEAIKNGLKRAGIVFDGNVFKKYYLNMIIKVSNKYKMPIKLFNNEEETYKWFKSFKI